MSKNTKHEAHLAHSRGVAGLEREAYFSQPGATVEGWRGGRSTVWKDRRKEADRRACRDRVET